MRASDTGALTLHARYLLIQKYEHLKGQDLLIYVSPVICSAHFCDSPATSCWTPTPVIVYSLCVNHTLSYDKKMFLNLKFTELILGPTFFQFAVKRNKLIYMSKYDTPNAKFGGIKLTWQVRRA